MNYNGLVVDKGSADGKPQISQLDLAVRLGAIDSQPRRFTVEKL